MGRKARIAGGFVGGSIGAYIAAGYYDEGLGRTQTFWARAFPVFLQYRWVQLLNRDLKWIDDDEAQARYEALHDICAPKVRDLCSDMRGYYLKNAQMLATREDFFPQQYIRWMRKMEDEAPTPFEDGDAERIVEAELGRPLSEVFSFFDPKPSGVASIGQVHRAVLRDSGKEVAVKVQHYGAKELFAGDVKTQKTFCELFMPQYVPALAEIEKQHLTEFDYTCEAQNLNRVREQLHKNWKDRVVVPQAYSELCTERVLTMDYLHGVKLVEGIRASYRDVAERMGKSLDEIEEEQRRRIKSGEAQLKSIAEESQSAEQIRFMLRCRDIAVNTLRVLLNLTPLPYLLHAWKGYGFQPYKLQWTMLPLNLGDIMKLLVDVHAEQLFIHGSFNTDPHPGNVLLLEDGRLGLIDFGQVKHLDAEARTALASITQNLVRGNKDAVAMGLRRLGSETRTNNPEVHYRLAAFWLDRDTDDVMTWEGKVLNIADFIDAMEAADPVVTIAENLIMPGRMVILLRGLGLALGMRLRMAQLMEPAAATFLASPEAVNLA